VEQEERLEALLSSRLLLLFLLEPEVTHEAGRDGIEGAS
jgi:hypothetical protein